MLVKLSFCDQSAPTVLSLDGFDSVVPDPVPYVLERENPARHHAGGPGYVGQQVDTLEGRFCGDEIRRRLRHGISVGGSGEVHPAEDRVVVVGGVAGRNCGGALPGHEGHAAKLMKLLLLRFDCSDDRNQRFDLRLPRFELFARKIIPGDRRQVLTACREQYRQQ